MASPTPPPGFVMDDGPAPPPGFQMDAAPPPPPGFAIDHPLPAQARPTRAPSTATGAFTRGALRSALPTAGGVAAFGPGAAAGALIAAPVAPFAGPFAPIVEGGGALLGGAASSLGAGWAVDKAQNYVLDRFPALRKALGQDVQTRTDDEAQHPYASFAGEVIPQAAFLRPGWTGKAPALVGGTIGGATEAAREFADDGTIDPMKVGIAAGAGALMQKPTRLGRAVGIPNALPPRRESAPPSGYVLDEVPSPAAQGAGGINPKTGRLSVNISAANDAPPPPDGFTVDPIDAPSLSRKPAPMMEPANDRVTAAAETIQPEDVLPLPTRQIAPEQPPVEAPAVAEPGPSPHAGNIDLSRLQSPQDIHRALTMSESRSGGFDAAKRGRIGHEETQALASDLGMKADDLLRRRRGQALNAEQAVAARQIIAKSGNELVNLAKRVKGGSDEELAAFRQAWVRHVAIQEQVSGMTAEAGRALQSFRMLADSRDAMRHRVIEGVITGGGGRERLSDIAERLSDLDDPEAINAFARQAMKARTRDKLNEVWINSLLSGPKTHAVNIASNVLTSLWTLPEQALAAGFGAATRSADRVLLRDVGARAMGMMQGAREGLKLAKRAFLTGEPTDARSKVEAANYRTIPGKLGEIIRIPTRALTAEDEFFKEVARRGEINAQAWRFAHARGGTAAEKAARYAELKDNPTPAMLEAADKQAQYLTFQKPLGPGGRGIQQFANEVPGAKLVIPFIRTPINILKFAAERSVLAPAFREWRDMIKAGGRQKDEAMARLVMGSGLSALAVSSALDGKLSGAGPSDPREQAALRDTGWQPYSIRIGDTWYSYQRFEPISLLAGVAADFADLGNYMTPEESDRFALNLSIAVAKNVTSKTWLSGLSDFFDVLSDPERYGRNYVARLAGSMAVPGAVSQVASATDPNLREARNILDTIKSRVPGLSATLPERLNLWGQPIERGKSLGPDLVSPVWASEERNDPLMSEVARLRLGLTKPQRKIGGIELSPDQYARYVYMAGSPARAYLDAYVASPEWQDMPDPLRARVIRKTVELMRERAKIQMLMAYPELQQAEVESRVQRRIEGR